MFGVLTMHLNRLVNYGHSFEGAKELYDLLSTYPLNHSFFHLFEPQRKKLPIPTPRCKDISEMQNFYFVKYDRDKGIATGKYHSEVGTETYFEIDEQEGLKKIKCDSKHQNNAGKVNR